jgi:hypothetical protein
MLAEKVRIENSPASNIQEIFVDQPIATSNIVVSLTSTYRNAVQQNESK